MITCYKVQRPYSYRNKQLLRNECKKKKQNKEKYKTILKDMKENMRINGMTCCVLKRKINTRLSIVSQISLQIKAIPIIFYFFRTTQDFSKV